MQKFKIKKYIAASFFLFALSVGFTSCLKEKDSDLPPLYGRSTPNVISFQDNGGKNGDATGYAAASTEPYPLYQFSFKLVNGSAGFDAIVIYGPTGTAPQDITLKIAVDPNALDAFNNANSTSYTIPDASNFSVPSTVVIKKGQSQAYCHITISPNSTFDFNASYAIPLTITSTSYGSLSSNFSSEINAFGVQNQYDGQYSLRIKTVGWGAYGIADNVPGTYPKGMGLVTAGPYSVATNVATFGNLQPALTAAGGATGFGATTPLITFDPATNKIVSIVNTTPNDGRNRTLYLNPAVTDSRYDPATKTVYAAYIMTQNGRPLQYIYDTLVYQGPR